MALPPYTCPPPPPKYTCPFTYSSARRAGGSGGSARRAREAAAAEAARKAREAALRIEEAARKAREEAARKAREEAARKAREEAARKAREIFEKAVAIAKMRRKSLTEKAFEELIKIAKKKKEEKERKARIEAIRKEQAARRPPSKPLLELRQVDTFKSPVTGKIIPITQLYHVDPKLKAVRKATQKEERFYEKYIKRERIRKPIYKPILKKVPKLLPPVKKPPIIKIKKPPIKLPPIKEPYLEERQIGSIRSEKTGALIPVTKIFLVDPKKKTERKATEEERKSYLKYTKVLELPKISKERGVDLLSAIEKERNIFQTKRRRGKSTVTDEAKLFGLVVAGSLLSTAEAIRQIPKMLPAALVGVVKDPKSITRIPKAIKREATAFGQLVRVSPTEAVAKVGTEILILKGIGKLLKVTGSLTSKAATRISPKFRGVKAQVISVPSKQIGKTINIELGGTVKQLSESLKKQITLAGKEVTAVSAQADRLIRLMRRTKVVRKPIPGEGELSKATKKLLKKFDEGKIRKNELIILDQKIRRETGRAGSLLERSFFADPKGRLRPSRLGVRQKEASLSDILTGDITFKTQKPQVLIFEKAKVEKFPKALQGIKKKLKAGKPLTRAEANKFLQFQLKKSAKFKPVGAVSKEPEITLAPGEIIKKEKTIAVTIIQGKRVPIIRAKVIKARPETRRLLKKARTGKLTTKELKKLRVNLKKETGFKTSFSRGRIGKPRVRVPKRIPRRLRKVPRRPPRRVPRRRPLKRKPRRVKRVARRPPKRVPRRVPRRPPVRPRPRPRPKPRVGKPPVRPIIRPRKKIKRKIKKAAIKQGYDVYGKYKRKFIKLNKVPLSKTQALDRGAFAIDKSTGVTYKIKGVGKVKRLGKLTKGEKGHFSRTKKKYRSFRIQKGKKITLKDKYIEKKGTPRIDTRGEKKQLSLARFAKQRRFIGRMKPTKKPRRKTMKPRIPLKLKKLSRTVIKKAPKGKKPTRWRFKGNRRLGFRNNKVVEIVKFNQRSSPKNPRFIKRKATPEQLRNLAKGRKILAEKRKRR